MVKQLPKTSNFVLFILLIACIYGPNDNVALCPDDVDREEQPPTVTILEDCPETTTIRKYLNNNTTKTITCNNVNSIISSACEGLSRCSPMTFYSTCPSARFLGSFLSFMNIDFSMYSTRDCYRHNKNAKILQKSKHYNFVYFLVDILDKLKLNGTVVITDDSIAMPTYEIQRLLNENNIRTSVASMSDPNFKLEKSLKTWSKSYNFFVFCKIDNKKKIMETANRLGLLAFPYTWLVKVENLEMFKNYLSYLKVEYTYRVHVCVPLNNETNLILEKHAITINVMNVRNLSDVHHNNIIEACATNNFKSFERNTTKNAASNTLKVDQAESDIELGYTLYRLSMKCKGVTPINENLGRWTTNRPLSNIIFNWTEMLSLDGCKFNVGITNNPPFVRIEKNDNGTHVTGTDIDLLDTLSQVANFTYTLVTTNMTMTRGPKLQEFFPENEISTIDIVLPAVPITAKRNRLADFTACVYVATASVIIKKPGLADELFSDYIRAFDTMTWIMIGISMLVTAVCFVLTNSFHRNSWGRTRIAGQHEAELNWWNSLCAIFCIVCQQGIDRAPTTASGRIIFGTFLFAVVIIMFNYSSLLICFLTVNQVSIPFTTIDQLVQRADYTVGMLKYSNFKEILETTKEPSLQKLWKKLTKDNNTSNNIVLTLEEALEKVATEKYALVAENTIIDNIIKTNCTFYVVLNNIMSFFSHIPVRNHFPYTAIISQHMTRIRETGVMAVPLKRYKFQGRSMCPDDVKISSIDLDHVAVLFYILALGTVLSAIVFVIERFLYWKCGGRRALDARVRRRTLAMKLAVRKQNESRIMNTYAFKVVT